MSGPMRVTMNQRVLVHLLGYVRAAELGAVPPGVTQQGIADALGVRRSHVTIALQALHRRSLVEDRIARVVGEVRKKKAYALTPLGYARAQEARPFVLAPAFVPNPQKESFVRSEGREARALG